MKSKLPILLYHDLESDDYPNEKSEQATRDTVVTAENFESQIRYLAENNYETISVKDYFRYVKQDKTIFSGKIIITFDDGHYSNYYLAYPVLLKYGFKATFFITADRINKQYYLTRDQIKEMADKGMEIGSHGLTHKYLPTMNSEEVMYELSESKRILESIIKQTVDLFAFPGGYYNREVLKLLNSSGYKGACSCLQGLNSLKTNPYLLRRIEIRRNVSIEEFRHIFNPLNIAFYQFIDSMKSLLRKSIGLNAYSNIRAKLYKYYLFKR